jgi:hypothetical protein
VSQSRQVLILALFSSLALGCGSSVQVDPWSSDFFPIKEGNQWIYAVEGGSDSEETMSVSASEAPKIEGDTAEYELEIALFFGWGVFAPTTPIREEQGSFMFRMSRRKELDGPWVTLASEKKSKWKGDVMLGDVKGTFEGEMLEGEKVSVPAGSYSCIPVKISFQDEEGTSGVLTTWYAKGVGPVQSILEVDNRGKNVRLVRKLKEFRSK